MKTSDQRTAKTMPTQSNGLYCLILLFSLLYVHDMDKFLCNMLFYDAV